MNLSRLFILRPIATALLMVAVLISGLLAYRLLPISALPEVDYPTIQVTTLYPGASPDVMTSNVTAPLERQFGQMPGLDQMSSTSSGGASVVSLRFALDMSMDVAEQQVQAAINAGTNLLPSDLPMPPLYSKVNPADAPVLTLAISSPSLPVIKINDLVENRLAPKLSQVKGVGLVAIAGARRPAVRIQANPAALASFGMTLDDVRSAISAANVKTAKGSFDGPNRASTIDANDQMQSAAEYRNLIIAFKNGNPVRLSDVAQTVDDAENTRLAAWSGTPETGSKSAVILNIRRQPGANVIATVDAIKTLLPQLKETLPASIDVQVLTDRTVTIRASVKDMQFELALAIALVVMVIFLFLRSASATLIPSVAVPLSLVGTFGVMYLAGFSINNLTLMALTIATGFVVDDAIVMIENIARYVEKGEPPMQAALKGSKQIGFTIISLTISLVAVLIPLLFMGDVVGRLFHEFAITMTVAILISAVVSLTLTPMLCARLLRHKPESEQQKAQSKGMGAAVARFFDKVIAEYGRMLTWVLDHSKLTWLVFVATLVVTVLLYFVVPKGFFPEQDTGTIAATTEADQSISFAAMAERQQALAEHLLKDPAVASISSFIGVDGTNTTLNTGRIQIDLKPHGQRDRLPVVLNRLAEDSQAVPGIRLYAQPVQDLTIEDRQARTQYQLLLSSPDMTQLTASTKALVEKLQQLPQLLDVSSDLQNQGRQAYVQIDRAQASRLGVTVASVDSALYNAFGQRLISTIFTQSNQYRVVLEVAPQFKVGPEALQNIYAASSTGAPVPLSSIATVSERPMALAVNHVGQLPAATISFNTAPGVSLGHAVEAAQAIIQQLRDQGQIPLSVDSQFQGAALAFQASLSNTLLLVLAAIITMYIVLGVLYESTIHPITILSTLPSAGVGALLALLIAGLDLDIIAIIGIILLIGIVKKNAIMMIDFALDAQREEGMNARDAIYQACLLRFRPILMTTLAALLSALPMMLGTGVGAELRQPLGVTLVGGLLLSQLLTLFTTPVIYLTFENWAENWRTRRGLPAVKQVPHSEAEVMGEPDSDAQGGEPKVGP